MKFKLENSPHVTHVVDLEIGEKVLLSPRWGGKIGGKIATIEDIKLADGASQTGIAVKISTYHNYVDSAWIEKIT